MNPYLRAHIARGTELAAQASLLAAALARARQLGQQLCELEILALTSWQQLRLGDHAMALKSITQAARLAQEIGYVRVLADIPELRPLLQQLPAEAMPSGLLNCVDRGSIVTLTLTEQEHRVLALLATDQTYQQIANELVLSINTVRTHIRHLYAKLGVRKRDQAIAAARRQRLLA